MTERSKTAIKTAEAITKLLVEGEEFLPSGMDGRQGYELAILKVKAIAISFRLSAPQPRRRSRPKGE